MLLALKSLEHNLGYRLHGGACANQADDSAAPVLR